MGTVVKYSLVRVGLFVVVLLVLWAFGVHGILPILLAAVITAALSYLLLRRMRDDMVRYLMERKARRDARRVNEPGRDPDERFEDAFVDRELGLARDSSDPGTAAGTESRS